LTFTHIVENRNLRLGNKNSTKFITRYGKTKKDRKFKKNMKEQKQIT